LRFAASKLRDREAAVDVVQETFLSAYSSRETYNPEFAVSTWLWTILMNLCRRQWKQSQRRAMEPLASAPEPLALGSAAGGGLQKLLQQERSEVLAGLLAVLPEPQADAIRLRFFGELAFDEIAATLQSSLSGAKKRVKQGLMALAEKLRTLEELDS
jgi:RNA polymerase sigma-70 factor (ECF subfamily)